MSFAMMTSFAKGSSTKLCSSPVNMPKNFPQVRFFVDKAIKDIIVPGKFAEFNKGCGFLIPETTWDRFPAKNGFVGRDTGDPGKSGQFVAPLAELRKVIQMAKTWPDIEKSLGLPCGALGQSGSGVMFVSLFEAVGIREPANDSPGANALFVDGGKTSGGVAEGFVSLIDLNTTMFMSDGAMITYKNVAITKVMPGDIVTTGHTGPLAGTLDQLD